MKISRVRLCVTTRSFTKRFKGDLFVTTENCKPLPFSAALDTRLSLTTSTRTAAAVVAGIGSTLSVDALEFLLIGDEARLDHVLFHALRDVNRMPVDAAHHLVH